MAIYPVIMCGGAGVRLWPASRHARPKQFTALVGEYSSFQNTIRRVAGIKGAAETVVGLTDSFKPKAEQRGLYMPTGVGGKHAQSGVVLNLNPQRLVAASGH